MAASPSSVIRPRNSPIIARHLRRSATSCFAYWPCFQFPCWLSNIVVGCWRSRRYAAQPVAAQRGTRDITAGRGLRGSVCLSLTMFGAGMAEGFGDEAPVTEPARHRAIRRCCRRVAGAVDRLRRGPAGRRPPPRLEVAAMTPHPACWWCAVVTACGTP